MNVKIHVMSYNVDLEFLLNGALAPRRLSPCATNAVRSQPKVLAVRTKPLAYSAQDTKDLLLATGLPIRYPPKRSPTLRGPIS